MAKTVYIVKENVFEKQAPGALLEVLRGVSFISDIKAKNYTKKDMKTPDILVRFKTPASAETLVVAMKRIGEIRYARQAINQLARYKEGYPGSYGVFMAPYISPETSALCRAEGVGFMDLAGNCFMEFKGIYINREGKPNPFLRHRPLMSLYYPKSERVLRVLLSDPKRSWSLKALAGEAQVNVAHVYKIKERLRDSEWIVWDEDEKEGLRLKEPLSLLKDWAANYGFRKNKTIDLYSIKSPGRLESAIAELCGKKGIRYAFTGFSGAVRMAPYVRYLRAMVYIEDIEELVRELELKEAPTGANLTLLVPYDEGVYYGARDIEGSQVVGNVQLYLDLASFKGRGEEAAEFLFNKAMKPLWR